MAEIEMKTLTPDTTIDDDAYVMGADSQSATAPSMFSMTTISNYLAARSNTWTGVQTFEGDVTITGAFTASSGSVSFGDVTASGGTLNVGVNDTTAGRVDLYGSATGAGGQLRIYNPADQDTDTGYWQFLPGQASGDLLLTDSSNSVYMRSIFESGLALAETHGTVIVGAGDSVPGLLSINGGGPGENAGALRIYNNADNDSIVDYYYIRAESGQLAFGNDDFGTSLFLYTSGSINFRGPSFSLGIDDNTPGNLVIYGGGAGENGGSLLFYNSADNDTNTQYLRMYYGSADDTFRLAREGASASDMTITNTGAVSLSLDAGTVNIGNNDDTPGILTLYGGGTGEAGGEVRLYNNADDDTVVNYWRVLAHDSTGDLRMVTNTGTVGVSITPSGGVQMPNLPTSNPGGSGLLWNDAGTLKIT